MRHESIGVAYLLRGRDAGWQEACQRFTQSYVRHAAGREHQLYVVTKGFEIASDKRIAKQLLAVLPHVEVAVTDESYDIGAYRDWASGISEDVVCLLGTSSEILGDSWLLKLDVNLRSSGVGAVGATGSFESLGSQHMEFPPFPNPHLRTTGCLMRRDVYLEATSGLRLRSKEDAYRFESGWEGLTRRLKEAGLSSLVVGRNGRGYSEELWPVSDTFRQGRQRNVLIGDRNTRMYAACAWHEKRFLASRAWGAYLDGSFLYRWG